MQRTHSLKTVGVGTFMAGCFPKTTGVGLYTEKEKACELGQPSEQVGIIGEITYRATG